MWELGIPLSVTWRHNKGVSIAAQGSCLPVIIFCCLFLCEFGSSFKFLQNQKLKCLLKELNLGSPHIEDYECGALPLSQAGGTEQI